MDRLTDRQINEQMSRVILICAPENCGGRGQGLKMTVFWDVAPCSLVEIARCFRDAYCLHHQDDCPDDGGSKHL
jgi:hypothetical protein